LLTCRDPLRGVVLNAATRFGKPGRRLQPRAAVEQKEEVSAWPALSSSGA
jgi:hypothetical protein